MQLINKYLLPAFDQNVPRIARSTAGKSLPFIYKNILCKIDIFNPLTINVTVI